MAIMTWLHNAKTRSTKYFTMAKKFILMFVNFFMVIGYLGSQPPVFFFLAEDGIRDWSVTGVQTCALPISAPSSGTRPTCASSPSRPATSTRARRSEERRVGKECRSRWSPYHQKKKKYDQLAGDPDDHLLREEAGHLLGLLQR